MSGLPTNGHLRKSCESYTIEVRKPGASGISCNVVAQLTGETWNLLWDELGVAEKDWDEWHNRSQTEHRYVPIVDGLNEISMLAYIDEGSVHFNPKSCMKIVMPPCFRSQAPPHERWSAICAVPPKPRSRTQTRTW